MEDPERERELLLRTIFSNSVEYRRKKKKRKEGRKAEESRGFINEPLEENRDTRSNKEPREDGRHRAPGQFRIILFHREFFRFHLFQ